MKIDKQIKQWAEMISEGLGDYRSEVLGDYRDKEDDKYSDFIKDFWVENFPDNDIQKAVKNLAMLSQGLHETIIRIHEKVRKESGNLNSKAFASKMLKASEDIAQNTIGLSDALEHDVL